MHLVMYKGIIKQLNWIIFSLRTINMINMIKGAFKNYVHTFRWVDKKNNVDFKTVLHFNPNILSFSWEILCIIYFWYM